MVAAAPKTASGTRRRRILLVMPTGYSNERRAGVVRYATEANWILDSRLTAHLGEGDYSFYLATTEFDGCLAMSTGHLKPPLEALTVPVVDMWHDHPEMICPRVLQDHHAVGRVGAQHLLERGFQNLLFYTHTVDRRVALIRQEGFMEAAKEEPTHRNIAVYELTWGRETPMEPHENRLTWLGRMLSQMKKPLGVMAVNDAVAAEVVDAAMLIGLKVPEDVAVVGVDNDPILTELGAIPISSVDNARERIGYEAAALLDRMIDGETPPTEPVLIPPAGVVLRQSTEVVAVDDVNVGKAARFIRDHFREPISVNDVAAKCFLSRRRLQDLFREALGHGMSEEILRQRLLCSQHLLTNTTNKIDRIARMSGFRSGMRMSKVYQRELGTTPQQYRQNYRSSITRTS